MYISKEKNSEVVGHFRLISLFNVEGKIFFADLASRYLLINENIDTSVQKGVFLE